MSSFVSKIEEVAENNPDVLLKNRDQELNQRRTDTVNSELASDDLESSQRDGKSKGRARNQKQAEAAITLGKRHHPEADELKDARNDKKVLYAVPGFNQEDDSSDKMKIDSARPKKAQSGYFFFSQNYREALKHKSPNASYKEVNKEVSEKWSKMSKKEKAPYEKMASEDRDRYSKELAEQKKK